MKLDINFNDWFDSQHLLQQKSNTFKIWYKMEYSYVCYRPIQISSEIVGTVFIPDLEDVDKQGYQLIGKICGNVEYVVSNDSINDTTNLSINEGINENINEGINEKM